MLVYRRLSVIAIVFSLTACSAQQVQDAALFTAGAALHTAVALNEIIDEKDSRAPCPQPVGEDTSVNPGPVFRNPTCPRWALDDWKDEQLEAAYRAEQRYREEQRRAELNAALDAYQSPDPEVAAHQRSVVFVPAEPTVPQQSIDRLDAVIAEPD